LDWKLQWNVTTGVRSSWIGDCSKKLYRHAMKVEQMMDILQAEIRTIQEELEAILKASYEEMRAE
jgi:hypothetical protein